MSNYKYRRISRDDRAELLVNHKCGLTTLFQNCNPCELNNSALALADVARYFKLPAILTTSFEDGPNEPIVPEAKAMVPTAPLFARPRQIVPWDNQEFVKAVKDARRNQLIIAGIVTEVCVAFPAISAIKAGYHVFVVTDASSTFDSASRDAA